MSQVSHGCLNHGRAAAKGLTTGFTCLTDCKERDVSKGCHTGRVKFNALLGLGPVRIAR